MSDTKYISLTDFPDGKGGHDWEAYKNAMVNNGDKCHRCGKYRMGHGRRDLCGECKGMDDAGDSVEHDLLIRCPHCKTTSDAYDGRFGGIYDDGEHDVTCDDCGKTFTIETRVSYRFTSRLVDDDES